MDTQEIKKGKLVVFEGPDFCGKDTEADLAEKALYELGHSVASYRFPNLKTPSGKVISDFLNGKFKERLNPDAVQSCYIANRYEQIFEMDQALYENDFVFVNRYAFSSIAYGSADGANRDYLFKAQADLLTPDLTIVFMLNPEEAMKRKRDAGRDIYESDLGLQNRVCEGYRFLIAHSDHRVVSLDATLPISELHKSVMGLILSLEE